MTSDQSGAQVTDAEIAEIVAAHEAGVGDLLAVYEVAEQYYMTAAQVALPQTIVSANTTPQ